MGMGRRVVSRSPSFRRKPGLLAHLTPLGCISVFPKGDTHFRRALPPDGQGDQMKKFFLYVLIVAAGLGGAQYMGWIHLPIGWGGNQTAQQGRSGRRAATADEPPVLTAEVRRADVPVTLDAVGTVQALNTVLVRAQVDGKLTAIKFKDGQTVKQDDVLATIDPTTYQALYDQAVAKKAQDEATLGNARKDLDRYVTLAASNFGSKQQADTQKALVTQLEAQTRLDQAAIDNAKAMLDYTTIRAPLDGLTGLRAVDAGNIVHTTDASGIVTITQVQPIAAIFNLPQQRLRAVNAGQARAPLTIQALGDDNKTLIDTGAVQVVDNLVDSTTGTVRVKASFPNSGNQLWPGQFTNMRLFIDTLKDAVVVPTAAVQRGPDGAFVYTVGDDRKARVTKVGVGLQDEQRAVILSGLVPPARVITSGFSQLTDGATVQPTAVEDVPAPGAAPAPQSGAGARRQRGDGGAGRRGPDGNGPQAGGASDGGDRRRQGGNAAGGGAPEPGAQAGTAAAAQ